MDVRNYENEPRYILETDYGCHSNYGWAFTDASDELETAKKQFEDWRKIPGSYRLIDNMTSRVLDIYNGKRVKNSVFLLD